MIISIRNFEKYFTRLTAIATIILVALSIAAAFSIYHSPIDYQQSNAVKIMYIHVPAAWMALLIYTLMAAFNLSGFIWKNPFFYLISKSIAPVGAMFAAITLVTGSIWGKPIWGTWFVFDPRLTSMLILFFLYVGYITVVNSLDDQIKAEKIAAVISIIGFVNVPIVKFSVEMWNSLHQVDSILRFGAAKKSTIDPSMLLPLLLTTAAYGFYFILCAIISVKSELIERRIRAYENR